MRLKKDGDGWLRSACKKGCIRFIVDLKALFAKKGELQRS